jgi:hypothetical protein
MSQLLVTSAADRSTSSRYGLRSLAHRIGGQGPHDNKSLPLEPTIHEPAGDALCEDTARRLPEFLKRPGVNGAVIVDLIGYAIEKTPTTWLNKKPTAQTSTTLFTKVNAHARLRGDTLRQPYQGI